MRKSLLNRYSGFQIPLVHLRRMCIGGGVVLQFPASKLRQLARPELGDSLSPLGNSRFGDVKLFSDGPLVPEVGLNCNF